MKREMIEVFIANDGTQFVTEQAAIDHENALVFDKLIAVKRYDNDDAGFHCIAEYLDFKDFVIANKEYVLQIMKEVQ